MRQPHARNIGQLHGSSLSLWSGPGRLVDLHSVATRRPLPAVMKELMMLTENALTDAVQRRSCACEHVHLRPAPTLRTRLSGWPGWMNRAVTPWEAPVPTA